jgi:hypothetical protein
MYSKKIHLIIPPAQHKKQSQDSKTCQINFFVDHILNVEQAKRRKTQNEEWG